MYVYIYIYIYRQIDIGYTYILQPMYIVCIVEGASFQRAVGFWALVAMGLGRTGGYWCPGSFLARTRALFTPFSAVGMILPTRSITCNYYSLL